LASRHDPLRGCGFDRARALDYHPRVAAGQRAGAAHKGLTEQ
jgi:hypothetical protein